MAPRYFLRTKEELEEEQKAIVDGADALLSLAGLNNNNNNDSINDVSSDENNSATHKQFSVV